jgi:cyclophilin family peptidyl-prolyl cis-trans isomerase
MRVSYCHLAAFVSIIALLSVGGCSKTAQDATPSAAAISAENGQAANDKVPPQRVPPEVVLDTTKGPITVRLDAEKAPRTVENFLKYIKSRFYDGTLVHQVYKTQGIIGGAYAENMTVKTPIGVPILNEAHNGVKNTKYTIAMLRDPDNSDTATSVFVINTNDNPACDFRERSAEGYGYCVFGQVVQGKEIVDQIAAVEVHDIDEVPCTPVEKVVVKSAKQIK